jgi:hypothetical protein
MPLEGLRWAEDMRTFDTREKDAWSWRVLIRQPDWLADDELGEAIESARSKGTDLEGKATRRVTARRPWILNLTVTRRVPAKTLHDELLRQPVARGRTGT